jgi:hypothetical protein
MPHGLRRRDIPTGNSLKRPPSNLVSIIPTPYDLLALIYGDLGSPGLISILNVTPLFFFHNLSAFGISERDRRDVKYCCLSKMKHLMKRRFRVYVQSLFIFAMSI